MAKPRADQPGLPEIGDEYNKRIHSAAKAYVRLRDARMEATELEDAAKTKLIDIMHEEAVDTYCHKDVDVCLSKIESVKVKVEKKKDDDGGE